MSKLSLYVPNADASSDFNIELVKLSLFSDVPVILGISPGDLSYYMAGMILRISRGKENLVSIGHKPTSARAKINIAGTSPGIAFDVGAAIEDIKLERCLINNMLPNLPISYFSPEGYLIHDGLIWALISMGYAQIVCDKVYSSLSGGAISDIGKYPNILITPILVRKYFSISLAASNDAYMAPSFFEIREAYACNYSDKAESLIKKIVIPNKHSVLEVSFPSQYSMYCNDVFEILIEIFKKYKERFLQK